MQKSNCLWWINGLFIYLYIWTLWKTKFINPFWICRSLHSITSSYLCDSKAAMQGSDLHGHLVWWTFGTGGWLESSCMTRVLFSNMIHKDVLTGSKGLFSLEMISKSKYIHNALMCTSVSVMGIRCGCIARVLSSWSVSQIAHPFFTF